MGAQCCRSSPSIFGTCTPAIDCNIWLALGLGAQMVQLGTDHMGMDIGLQGSMGWMLASHYVECNSSNPM